MPSHSCHTCVTGIKFSEGNTREPTTEDTQSAPTTVPHTSEDICFQTLCWLGCTKSISSFCEKICFPEEGGEWDIFSFIFLQWTHLNCHKEVTMETAPKLARYKAKMEHFVDMQMVSLWRPLFNKLSLSGSPESIRDSLESKLG